MIVLENVVKEYPNGVGAINGISLHIERGEFVFVVGDSGSGKSTLIKLLLKELEPALVNSPDILLADEPTGNLDPKTSREIMKLLEEINARGTTVLVVTHDQAIVNTMKKRVIRMQKGIITEDEKESGYIG